MVVCVCIDNKQVVYILPGEMRALLLVVTVLASFPIVCHAMQTEYFVKPTEGTSCPALPCHTLSYYLEDTARYFVSNTRFNFLIGVHEINKSGVVRIGEVTNLTLAGYVSTSLSQFSMVKCMKRAILYFWSITNLEIKDLSIAFCGRYSVQLSESDTQSISVAILLESIVSLKLSNITVKNSSGFGVLGSNILGISSVSHSRFEFNNHHTLKLKHCDSDPLLCKGGNMFIMYKMRVPRYLANITNSVLTIDSSVFSNGVDVSSRSVVGFGPSYYKTASGLGIVFSNLVEHKVDVLIRNVVSTKNVAVTTASNLCVVSYGNLGVVRIINTTSSMADQKRPNTTAFSTAGMQFFYSALQFSQTITANQTLLYISDSTFNDNIGGGIYISVQKRYNDINYWVIIKNCSFESNIAITVGDLSIQVTVPSVTSLLEVLVEDSNFTNHTRQTAIADDTADLGIGSVVSVHRLQSAKFINCKFKMNKQTALFSYDSTLYFGGDVIFSGNNGTFGGALKLRGESIFYLMPNTSVQITNNHAKRGGGIFVEDERAEEAGHLCFFKIMEYHLDDIIDPMVFLVNNTAEEAGSALYGGDVDYCYIYSSSLDIPLGIKIFGSLFEISEVPSSPVSIVSSDPFKVHLCTQKWITNELFETQTVYVYAGQNFKIPVVLYGQWNGSVPGIVHANFIKKSRDTVLGSLQETQQVRFSCTTLMYTVFTTAHDEELILSVNGLNSQFANDMGQVKIVINLVPCPPGFHLSDLTAQCECAQQLQEKGLLCNITGTIPLVQRTRSTWISAHTNRSRTNTILLHDHCPFDYCKPTRLWLQLDYPDEQCAHGHSGLLCGRCKSNLSLAIGTSQCLECTNTHLVLFLPFALAGVVLVLFLIVCNLTVSMGTINGLIFYANIVRENHTLFFMEPTTSIVESLQQVLSVFIAWLNLDLGIETCFFNGMDAYIRTWMQFAFPFYIWILVGVIIYLSRRYTFVVKLVGSSAISVLATLFLLSYAKLQRTVIAAFSFTYLPNYSEDGTSLAVWLYDGSVPFLQGKHIALFVMALAVTLLYIVPFTLLLLFAPCIQASKYWVVKRLKRRINPLLDAYQGPYKDQFRFWSGLMLVIRSILLVGFGLNILGNPDINHLLTVTVLTCLLVCTGIRGSVYKNTILHIIESSFIFNLVILSSWTMYNRHVSSEHSFAEQTILVCTSTGVAFATFICILSYHIYLRLKSMNLHTFFKVHKTETNITRKTETVEGSVESAIDAPPHRPPTVTVIELREPLLTDN